MSSKEPAPVDQAEKAEDPVTRYSEETCKQLGYEYFDDKRFALEQKRHDAMKREMAKRQRERDEERDAACGKGFSAFCDNVADMVPELYPPAQDAQKRELESRKKSKPSTSARSPSPSSDAVAARSLPLSASARAATPPPQVNEERLKTEPYD